MNSDIVASRSFGHSYSLFQTSNVSVSTNGGTVGVAMTLPNADRDYAVGTLGMRWKLGELNAEASYEYRSGDNGYSENRFNLSLSSSF